MATDRFLLATLTRSPQSVDPLSWFIRPFLPVTFALAMAIVGLVFVVGTADDFDGPAHQLIAVLCFVLACLAIHRPIKLPLSPFRLRHAIVPLLLAWTGVVVSGIGVSPGDGDIERWWPTLGVALVLAALAPFNSAIALVVFGVLSMVVCSIVAVWAFAGTDDRSIVSVVVVASLVPVQATVASSLFSAFVVDRVMRWSSLPIMADLSDRTLDFSKWNAGRDELQLLSDRVIPFLEQMAHDGYIATRDRTLAAELGREVRDELLKTVDRSWLESLASERGLNVIDPRHRAVRLSTAQRTAVRSLIVAVLESSALVPDTLSIELRDSAEGGVAIGLTMRLDLPEGKRMMLLAPYYLTLRAAVDDLTWDDQDQLNMRFRIPAPGANRD